MRGRKPKPVALRVIEGNRGKRRLPRTPEPPAAAPDAPDHLDEAARAEWGRIVAELMAVGLVTRPDRAALAAYCVTYSRWVKAERRIQETAELVRTPNGSLQQSPWVSIANRSLELMYKFLTEFGLTPVSRVRLSAKEAASSDPAEKYFG